MRLLILLALLVCWPVVAAAQDQSITVAGCEVLYTNAARIADPADDTKTLRGEFRRTGLPVEIRCPDLQVFAQEIDYFPTDERLTLRGQVVFQQGGTRIAATAGTVDLKTRNGRFETASGSLQLTDREVDRTLFGSMEPEALFTAVVIEKIGPRKYRLTDATFSTCVQPSRRWEVMASRLTFTVDRYALMTNARLLVKDVPMLYLPVFYYPIQEDDRATGFLMPSYGSSTFRGFTLSNAFFWAISRSTDATFYHDWFSRSGQGLGTDFRYVGHAGGGNARFYAVNQKALLSDDGTSVVSEARRSYEVRGNLMQTLPGRIRVQARADFFTDATTSQLYQSDINAFSRRSRYYGADASGNWGRLRAGLQAERNDIFYGTTTASSYRYQPRLTLGVADAPLGRTKIYVGGSLDAMSMVRFDDVDNPATRTALRRSDAAVSVRAPLSLGSALTLSGGLSFRRTDWSVRRDPATGARLNQPIARHLIEMQARVVGPVFTRIFNTPGSRWVERFKHVIEPSVSIMRRSSFERFDELVQFDSVDTVVGGITQVSYGLSNRLLARVRQAGQESVVRDLVNLELNQTYYTDALAASYDQQYQSSFNGLYYYVPPPSKFSPVRATLNVTPTATTSGQFGLEYDMQFKAVRSYRASVSVSQPVVEVTGSWSKRQVITGLPGYSDPSQADHFITLSGRVKRPGGGASASYAGTIDVLRGRVLQQRIGGLYNAQCCGVAFDYVVYNLSHFGLRNDKRFSLSFSLAGIGSFVNPLGVFGNNGRQ